jgi:predicted RNase H-like HicB family nuclease
METTMPLEYPVNIEKLPPEDGGGYLATVPLLPGCMSDGDTPEEALRNVQDAIAAWLDAARAWGRAVPEPVVAVLNEDSREFRSASRS